MGSHADLRGVLANAAVTLMAVFSLVSTVARRWVPARRAGWIALLYTVSLALALPLASAWINRSDILAHAAYRLRSN